MKKITPFSSDESSLEVLEPLIDCETLSQRNKRSIVIHLLYAIDYANNNGATIVLMGWGIESFSYQNTFSSYFQRNNVIYIASSGIAGGIVNWPSTYQTVISVGGTTLVIDASGSRITSNAETGWVNSGGGIDPYEVLPLYQSDFGLKYNRHTPDVSFVANPTTGVPVYSSLGICGVTGWFKMGGTSLSATCFSAIVALANQLRVINSKGILINSVFHYSLYNILAKGAQYCTNYFDITLGFAGQHVAKPGYDNVTGLGTPKTNSSTDGFIPSIVNFIP